MTINARTNIPFRKVSEGQSFYLGPKSSWEFTRFKTVGVDEQGKPVAFRDDENVWINTEQGK